jgi:hypothetical protein
MFPDEVTAHPEKANADKQRKTEQAHHLLTKEKNILPPKSIPT